MVMLETSATGGEGVRRVFGVSGAVLAREGLGGAADGLAVIERLNRACSRCCVMRSGRAVLGGAAEAAVLRLDRRGWLWRSGCELTRRARGVRDVSRVAVP